jgi:lipoate-protein ligase B
MEKQLCTFMRLGRVPYEQAWRLQERLAGEIARGERPAVLLLLEHPHVYTFGRRGQAENLLWDAKELERRGIESLWVDRGGDVTYHGPGQLVGYPLLPLGTGSLRRGVQAGEDLRLPQADYVGYLRKLEKMLLLALMRLGIAGGQIPGRTGIWVQPHVPSRCRKCAPDLRQQPGKIAAIGVKVDAAGVSRHGFALNLDTDPEYWEGIVACGLQDACIANLADLLDPPPAMEAVEQAVIGAFGEIFDYRMMEGSRPMANET